MDTNRTNGYEHSYLCEKIIEECYDSIVVTDADGRYIIANKATEECMGLSKEQILGKRPDDMMAKHVYTNSTILEAMRTKKTVTGLVNVRGVNRLSTSLPFLDEQGNVEFIMTNNRSNIIMDEFARQLAYEQEQHDRYRNIADYLYTSNETDMVCKSEKMHALRRDCATIAIADSSVMLIGESGVGKELIAKFIHSQSSRSMQAFIAVNCSAIPPELFESEFFGYRPGAFTGASAKGKPGFLRMAHGGTLFLDELGELPLSMQSKLLRFTESGEFYPVGSTQTEKVDVRIITATNRDLMQMVKEGSFRSDLYYRLHVIPIRIPALRERPEDIEAIAAYYIERYNKKYCKKTCLSEDSLNLLLQYRWPGNVRELRNVIERAVLMSQAGSPDLPLRPMLHSDWDARELREQDLTGQNQEMSNALKSLEASVPSIPMPDPDLPLADAIKIFEQHYIDAVIARHNGKLSEAARSLGIHRTTLYRRQKAIDGLSGAPSGKF